MTEFIIVFMTAPKEDEAQRIAQDIVSSRLAACVNIIRDIHSIYRWRGKIEDEGEVLMIVKTRLDLFGKLKKRVKELHSYSVPEIIALPLIEGSEEYLSWLKEETG
ncbi:MAG TPA: divalent-cation tolerance protein CutA [Candidatus Sulfobium mesophilum]|uniref:Divalent-cation tolerance protein CutA n=1 Tax=Candidatus Sulfobium mesophilum TaxID=2016548 RepID=A0A2U3QHF0_9BACT|nr:Divalent-cation tolerance protein CutA [Candidatus Sulfobium mesophilum]HSB31205.1 divalent-cation tolerance protein CutA [Candidatus Sulfobium mesophilum]